MMTDLETGKEKPQELLSSEEIGRLKERVVSYSRDSSIKIEVIEPDRAGKDQPESWAIDLERGKMYVDPRYFSDRGYSPTQGEFATYHEAEHLRELMDLLNEPNGDRVWRRQNGRARASRRYHLLDNSMADIRENRSVGERAPSVVGEKERLYREKLFPETVMMGRPKHLQLVEAILRESQLPDEPCELDGDVRDAIDQLKEIRGDDGRSVLEIMTDPKLDPSARLELQEEYLEPVYEQFFQEDAKSAQSNGTVAGGSGAAEGSGQATGDPSEPDGEKNEGEPTGPSQPGGKGEGEGEQTPLNPEDLFKRYYDEAAERSPDIAMRPDIQAAVNEYLATHAAKSENELNEEGYARAEGITLEQLRQYRRIYEQVAQLRDSETGELVVERLRQLFEQIIAERMLPKTMPEFPRSEGEVLINPAQAYADVLAGKEETESWMTFAAKERPREKYGNFDLHMAYDRSGSMVSGGKQEAQLIGAVLIQEALQELINRLDEEKARLKSDLNIRVEGRSFGVGEPGKPPHDVLKPLGDELTEKQRVAVAEALMSCSGVVTPDYLSLEDILNSTSENEWQEIAAGKRRKIIIVLTDGDSSDELRVADALEKLRGRGAVVVALGMTASAESVKTTYSPDGKVVEQMNQLASVLAKLLEAFLAELR